MQNNLPKVNFYMSKTVLRIAFKDLLPHNEGNHFSESHDCLKTIMPQ